MFEFKELKNCIACDGTSLDKVLDLGNQFVVDFIPASQLRDWKDGKKEQPIPLQLMVCKDCTFVQLGHAVNPDRLYRKFWYKSSINESMRTILKNIVTDACARVGTWKDMAVLDIGSNDGTLLSFYQSDVRKVGFDPAENLLEEAIERSGSDLIFADYFSLDYEQRLKAMAPEGFKVVTAIAMFYDLEKPKDFLNLIRKHLHRDGVVVIQMNYLLAMLTENAVDNIAHEHLGYYSLQTLQRVVHDCGLKVLDASVNDVNGGSIKVTLSHPDKIQLEEEGVRVRDVLELEENADLGKLETYVDYGEKIKDVIIKLNNFLRAKLSQRNRIYLYGASTRGSTLMQMLDKNVVSQILGAAERNPDKYDHFTVGGWIPIMPEHEAREDADIFLVLPWHFRQGILEREQDSLASGTKFLFPLPEPMLYSLEIL